MKVTPPAGVRKIYLVSDYWCAEKFIHFPRRAGESFLG